MKTRLLFIFLLTSLVGFSQNAIFTSTMTVTEYGDVDAPGGEPASNATDGNQTTKYLDFNELDGQAFTVDLGVGITAIAQSIEITTGNDAPARDATTYEVLGSNDFGSPSYTSIATGSMTCIDARAQVRKFDFPTTNTVAYRYYRVILSDVCDVAGSIAQVQEVQLYDAHIAELDPIFTPTMTVTEYGDVDAPGGEPASNATDGNQTTKYLDFNELDGQAFTVDLGVGITAKAHSIEVTTGNDAPARDATTYEVLGSNDFASPSYTSVATGSMSCIDTRGKIRRFNFPSAGTVGYRYYRVILSSVCDVAGSIAQVQEVQLYGTTVNATAGVNEHLFSEVAMYPNPTGGNVFFRNIGTLENASIKVFNVTGQLLRQETGITSKNYELNLDVDAGLYFIEVSSDNASKTYKLIKN